MMCPGGGGGGGVGQCGPSQSGLGKIAPGPWSKLSVSQDLGEHIGFCKVSQIS